MPGINTVDLYRRLLSARPDLAARFVIVTGDMIGARAELETLPKHQRPQLLENPSACSMCAPHWRRWPTRWPHSGKAANKKGSLRAGFAESPKSAVGYAQGTGQNMFGR